MHTRPKKKVKVGHHVKKSTKHKGRHRENENNNKKTYRTVRKE